MPLLTGRPRGSLGSDIAGFHDRRVPGTDARIDHVAIGASGVWLIETSRRPGTVQQRNFGTWSRPNRRLFVGGEDAARQVAALAWRGDIVRAAIAAELPDVDVPVRPALCFEEPQWERFARPFSVDGVFVTPPRALRQAVRTTGPVTPAQADEVTRTLLRVLPAA